MASPHLTTMTDPKPLATPEGDNEHLPDTPLTPDNPTPERPRGNEPHPTQPTRPALHD